jgi:hypothetical protein
MLVNLIGRVDWRISNIYLQQTLQWFRPIIIERWCELAPAISISYFKLYPFSGQR